MKDFIKETLRENINKNSLGVVISKPDQKLIIMRGIPGAGKSTKAKSLVGEGHIHSTDDVIESMGDYQAFFVMMIESKDYSALHKAHDTNFKNAKKSMINGISPIIIDNTNIKANEAKKFVVEALTLGYDDANISIVDVGTGGLEAEALAERNSHGVPLDKIESMIQSYNSVGPLSVKLIRESKDMFKTSDVLYSGVFLDTASRSKLLEFIGNKMPKGWTTYAHHMTIKLGELKDKAEVGKKVTLTVTEIGISDMAMAVKVEGYPSTNKIPHITIAVNPEGGKPVMSNEITKWQPVKHFMILGQVSEFMKGVNK
jgi:predicted kinase